MPRGRKLMPLILDPQQQDQLEGVARLHHDAPWGGAEGSYDPRVRRGFDQRGGGRAGRRLAASGQQSGAAAFWRPASRVCTISCAPADPAPLTTRRSRQ